MDQFRRYQQTDEVLSTRDMQELERLRGKSEHAKFPARASVNVATGEYPVPKQHKIDQLKRYSESKAISDQEKQHLKKHLAKVDNYELMGFQLGLFFAGVAFFLPGIRRTPFYLRIPISFGFFYFWVQAGRVYGKDITALKLKGHLENIEREYGIRHWQTGR